MDKKNIFIMAATVIACLVIAFFCLSAKKDSLKDLPTVAIANLGPLKDLEISIQGIKDELADNGFIDGKTVKIRYVDVAFDQSLIPQAIESLRNHNPKVMVAVTTPVAQFAKKKIRDIPLVFHSITDPRAAGLLKNNDQPDGNVTGASDAQNVNGLLEFIKSVLPEAKTVGMLYLTSDSNDVTMMEMVSAAAPSFGLTVFAIPVEQPRDISMRMQKFSGKVDLIYVGLSNAILAALPTISSEAKKMYIPVFAAEDTAVRDSLAVVSFGVNSESIGRNAGKLVVKLLKGKQVKDLAPIFPKIENHECFINKKLAEKFGLKIPKNAIVVGE
ncbi:MAG: ABC transporter substrate-binding protein [Holosporaceae bacterium]|jgi:putative ABC transport system substrate-binding protein|nr:ABC transporter substrate-binding protein [Holosporaceae bacterium]